MTALLEAIKWALPGVDMTTKPVGELLKDACLKVFEESTGYPGRPYIQILRNGLAEMNKKKAFSVNQPVEIEGPKVVEDSGDMNLRPNEKLVMDRLSEAWNTYLTLPRSSTEEIADFRFSVDRCHDLIARRVARRVDPDVWS
jgi:hypothetical protein